MSEAVQAHILTKQGSASASDFDTITPLASDELSVSYECEGHPELDTAMLESEVPPEHEQPVRLKQPTIVLDNRGLEPPQPMMRTLAALERCKPGEVVLIHNDRVPVFLIEELNQLGCRYTIQEQTDGTAKVSIEKGKEAKAMSRLPFLFIITGIAGFIMYHVFSCSR